ncbi:MAG: LysR substrate-binding domain-containing protein [Minicystis sp.]
MVSESRLSDVARRESDIGLRITRSSSKVLVERRLGVITLALYASQGYVDRRLPSATLHPGELGRHDFVGFHGALRNLPTQRFLEAEGATRFPFRTTSDASLLEATRCGQGIAVLPDITARQEGLVRLRFARPVPEVPVYLVSHREARRTPRIQLVARAVETAVRERLAAQ